ncbi:oxygenase MpaB family protein [Mycobacterium sp. 050272]|uniref:oxygenase MpaB family protein n=1 Tax=Mycobacterium sp. 050272 TaxID=3142488 RepID=UPI00318B9CC4
MTGAPGGSRWTDELLNSKREHGDPVADDVVEELFQQGSVQAVNDLIRTLVRNDQLVPAGLPGPVQNYLAHNMTLPGWADLSKINRGQKLFETWGLQISLCLFCASLPSAYAAANGVKVLWLTARLNDDARRRVIETGQFLMNVLAVGSFEPQGKGFRTIQHIRLMHAAVRKLIEDRSLKEPGFWDPHWGIPINQEDLAGTMLSFSYVPVEPMRRLGVRVSDEDCEAYLHLWNVIAHLLGIDDDMRVRGVDDATDLVETIRRRQFTASSQGQDMARALMELLDELTPGRDFDKTIPPLIRHLIGDTYADMLKVPTSSFTDDLGRVTRVVNRVWVLIFGRNLRNSPRYQLVSELARPFARDLMQGLFAFERGGERAPFDIPDHLARDWGLSKQ